MRKIKNCIIITLISLSFTNCSKWLDVKPADRIVEESVFNSEAGFLSALNGVYMDLLNPDLYGLALGSEFIEILAQQYSIRPLNVEYTQVNSFLYTNEYPKNRLENIWDASYRTILNCNKIIENADNATTFLSKNKLDILKGEASAVRAFLHFDLLRLFGPIYKINPDAKSIPYSERVAVSASELLPASKLIEKVLIDLTTAENLLRDSDPIVSEGPLSSAVDGLDNTDRFRTLRMNYYAVLALKARVYLYAGDKVNALKYAKLVIDAPNRSSYFPFVNYADILGDSKNPDRVFSTEILFGLFNTGRNTVFNNYNSPESASSNLLIPRATNIVALFAGEESDYRNFPIWKNSSLVASEVYNTKYKVGETPALLRNNMMALIRLGEMYLIAAESETNSIEAYNYLNVLRNNRGLTNVSDNLEARLRNEYVKEFYSEGQLFFYYKRNNITPIKHGITNGNVTMNAAKYVPLLPESEKRYR